MKFCPAWSERRMSSRNSKQAVFAETWLTRWQQCPVLPQLVHVHMYFFHEVVIPIANGGFYSLVPRMCVDCSSIYRMNGYRQFVTTSNLWRKLPDFCCGSNTIWLVYYYGLLPGAPLPVSRMHMGSLYKLTYKIVIVVFDCILWNHHSKYVHFNYK